MEQQRIASELAPVEQAIQSFKDQAIDSPELAREAFWRLLDNIKASHNRVKRSFALTAFFALAFELLNRGLVSEASVGGVKLVKLEPLKFVVPIAIGFLFFNAMSAIRDRNVVSSLYGRVSEAVYPDLHESGIDAALAPAGLLTSIFPDVYVSDRTRGLAAAFSTFEHVAVAILLPVGFFIYTTVQLFSQSGVASLGAWVSAVLTAILIAAGLAIMLIMQGEMEEG